MRRKKYFVPVDENCPVSVALAAARKKRCDRASHAGRVRYQKMALKMRLADYIEALVAAQCSVTILPASFGANIVEVTVSTPDTTISATGTEATTPLEYCIEQLLATDPEKVEHRSRATLKKLHADPRVAPCKAQEELLPN